MKGRWGPGLALVAVALVLLLRGRVWVSGRLVEQPELGTGPAGAITATGSDVAPAVAALALVCAAAAIAALLTGPVVSRVMAVAVVLGGLAVIGQAVIVLLDPVGALTALVQARGTTSEQVEDVRFTISVVLVVATGVALVISGIAIWRSSGSAQRAADADDVARRQPERPSAPSDSWAALDRGEDPTVDPGTPNDGSRSVDRDPNLPE